MTAILGHDVAVAAFRNAMAGGRMHHAWLLAGPQGVGKARFAEAAARRYLADGAGPPPDLPGLGVAEAHPTARLMAAGSHPDFMRLERLLREKTGDRARNINVEQVRGLQRLFATTPSFSSRRAVVIDAVDDLERSAANALLKNLEEPPADSLFLLVSHAPGRLLPTIRSRCRTLRLAALPDDVMTAVLQAEMPDSDAQEIAALVRIGDGAPGRALRFAGLDVAGLERQVQALLTQGDPTNAARVALARQLGSKAAQPRYELFLDLAPARIAMVARSRQGGALAEALGLWEKARSLADGAVRLSLDPQSVAFELAGMLARLAPTERSAKA